jgi:PiT family inorganic phosphate transporter
MVSSSLWPLLIVVLLGVGLGVVNGFNDAANAIATIVGTRVLSPRNALIMAGVLNFVGAATGLQVARTIGKGILTPGAISYEVAIAGLASVILWGAIATIKGLPVSLTHGFVSGLAGAGMAILGFKAVVWSVIWPILLWVFLAPLLGFIGGFIIMIALYWIFRRTNPSTVQRTSSVLQIFSSAFVAYSHGLNDGQMPVGVITMALVIYTGNAGIWNNIPFWVIILSSLAISLGTGLGGWNVIKTLGLKVTALRPVHGFAAETAAAIVCEIASLLGMPISTTHAISTAIMGVGATRRLSAVRWGVAGNIVSAWLLTFPLCGITSYLIALGLKAAFMRG